MALFLCLSKTIINNHYLINRNNVFINNKYTLPIYLYFLYNKHNAPESKGVRNGLARRRLVVDHQRHRAHPEHGLQGVGAVDQERPDWDRSCIDHAYPGDHRWCDLHLQVDPGTDFALMMGPSFSG